MITYTVPLNLVRSRILPATWEDLTGADDHGTQQYVTGSVRTRHIQSPNIKYRVYRVFLKYQFHPPPTHPRHYIVSFLIWNICLLKKNVFFFVSELLTNYETIKQCLGSGSVGFARFWPPGSGSAKICGSTDPDPIGKISTKNCKKKYSQPHIWTVEKKREIIKIPDFWMVHQVSA